MQVLEEEFFFFVFIAFSATTIQKYLSMFMFLKNQKMHSSLAYIKEKQYLCGGKGQWL